VASARKISTGSRRGPEKDEIIESILGSYHHTIPNGRRYAMLYGDLAKTGWLKRFAEEIAEEGKGRLAWDGINEKCNTSFIIELLYVLTFPEKLPGEKRTGVKKAFEAQIKKISGRYDKLRRDICRLELINPFVSLSEDCDPEEELQNLQESKQRLEALRDKKLSWKRTSRNFYRFLLADEVRRKTDNSNLEALATLIESAHVARGETKVVTADTLRRLVNRFLDSINAKVIDGKLSFGTKQTPSSHLPNPT